MIFKIAGIYFGLRTGGGPGMAAGLILGHVLDTQLELQLSRAQARRSFRKRLTAEANNLFYISLFSMLAKLAWADGPQNSQEVEAVETVAREALRLKRKKKKLVMKIFYSARNTAGSFHYYAVQFFELVQGQPPLLEGMLHVLFRVACADGPLTSPEEKLLVSAANIFNFHEEAYRRIKAQYGQFTNDDARSRQSDSQAGFQNTPRRNSSYEILGCNKTDSDDVIKKHYRQLVSDYHPDKILSKELPNEFVKFAQQKFCEIQNAYEAIQRERGLS